MLTNLHELGETHCTFINQVLNEEHKAKIQANLPVDSEEALFMLTEVLHVLHKREVIVLVDEYDTPMSYATQHDYFTDVVRLHKLNVVWI